MSYAANVLADSVGPHGIRLTTMEVTFPRAYLAELNTHRAFSRNSESSRAIPTELQIERVKNNPYIPEFAERVKGMGVGALLTGRRRTFATTSWLAARDDAVKSAQRLLGTAKDQANRLLEPFMWHTAIISATDWANFFALRLHPAAAPPMQTLAKLIHEAMEESEPRQVPWGAWHLPMISDDEVHLCDLGQEADPGVPIGAHASAGRTARSSYSTHHNPETISESVERWGRLAQAGHWSPAEHPARVCTRDEWDLALDMHEEYVQSCIWLRAEVDPVRAGAFEYWGNFHGWVQLRKHYKGEAVFSG